MPTVKEILDARRRLEPPAIPIAQPDEVKEAIAATSAGMNAAAKTGKDWIRDQLLVMALLVHVAPNNIVSSEGIRRFLETQKDFIEPPHKNVWGPLFRNAKRIGILEDTGTFTQSLRPSAHMHMSRVYTVNDPDTFKNKHEDYLRMVADKLEEDEEDAEE